MRASRSTILLAAATLAVAGCSADPELAAYERTPQPTISTPAWVASASAELARIRPCAEMFRPGHRVDVTGAQASCKDPDGTIQIIPVMRCNDGSHLGAVEPRTGASRGWFFAGQIFHAVAGDIAADLGYAAAVRKCNT